MSVAGGGQWCFGTTSTRDKKRLSSFGTKELKSYGDSNIKSVKVADKEHKQEWEELKKDWKKVSKLLNYCPRK